MQGYTTLTDLVEKLHTQKITASEAVEFYLENISKKDGELNSFITVNADGARAEARDIDARRAAGEKLPDLAGVPFGVKDAIDTAGVRSTGAAKILDTYVPPFDATVIRRLREAGAIVIGKQNCDAFGHGGSNENSMYGAVKNPWNTACVPGGSSGGSAAALAADLCAFSIGEDTGGSVRAPASFCGVTGLKVSYGRNSRYGAMPMASSLDTVGPFARTAQDIALILQHMAGKDDLDATSADAPVPNYREEIKKSVKGMKIGVPKEYFLDTLNPDIRAAVETGIKEFEKLGATIVPISLPHTEYAIAAYYVLVPCEDSSNMARLDGIRYGSREGAGDLYSTYTRTREHGFPTEVKRRIMIGTFALSHGYYDAYYVQAQKARTLIKQDFDRAFEEVDVIITPTAPEVAFKIGEKSNDPLTMYLEDVFVTPASLAGIAALSVPCGFVSDLPVGMQIMAPRLAEERALQFGHQYQQVTDWHTKHP